MLLVLTFEQASVVIQSICVYMYVCVRLYVYRVIYKKKRQRILVIISTVRNILRRKNKRRQVFLIELRIVFYLLYIRVFK